MNYPSQFCTAGHMGCFTKLVTDIIDFRRLVYHYQSITDNFLLMSAGVDFKIVVSQFRMISHKF